MSGEASPGHVGRREVDRIIVVAGIVFWSRSELAQAVRGKRRSAVGIVVMTTLAVVVVLVSTAVFVMIGYKGNVDVWAGLVSGRCVLPVGVTERSRLSQQQARQQHEGRDATQHKPLIGTTTRLVYPFQAAWPENLSQPPKQTASQTRVAASDLLCLRSTVGRAALLLSAQ